MTSALYGAIRPLFADSVAIQVQAVDPAQGLAQGFRLPVAVAGSVAKRQAEFIAGRNCARAALLELAGPHQQTIGIGPMRAPVWPEGFVGSIAHADGIAIAVLARDCDANALGVDIELMLDNEAALDLAKQIALPQELSDAVKVFGEPGLALTAIFCAKEALFKCLARGVGRYFDFLDAQLTVCTADALSLRLRTDLGSGYPVGQSYLARVARHGPRVIAGMTLRITS